MTTALTPEAIAEIINVGMQIKNDDSFATWLRLGKDIVFIDKVKENAGTQAK